MEEKEHYLRLQRNENGTADFFDNDYYKTIKKYLWFMGLYPYQSTNSRKCHLLFLLISMTSLVIPQLYYLSHVITDSDIDQIILCLPSLLTNSVCFVKVLNLHFNNNKFRRIFDLIKEDWSMLKTEKERCILEEFSENGKNFNRMYRNLVLTVLGVFVSVPMVPRFLDIILPRNESRRSYPLYEVDYIVDGDKYQYPIYVHEVYSTSCSIFSLIINDTMYMLIIHHACALFALCGYRIKNIIELTDDKKRHTNVEEEDVYHQLRQCVIGHKRAIEFADVVAASSKVSYLLLIGINMITISMTGVETIIKLHQLEEATRFGIFTLGQNIHLFFISIPGQMLLNYSSEFTNMIYSTEWYRIPLRMQKLISFMHLRSRKLCKLTAGELYTMDMENFAMVQQSVTQAKCCPTKLSHNILRSVLLVF